MKHTPGPWSFVREIFWVNTPGQQERHGSLLVYPEGNEDLTIAEVNDLFDKEKGRANARLIAAAPDMLEALENIENDDAHMPATVWDLIQKAIAKAKGESR